MRNKLDLIWFMNGPVRLPVCPSVGLPVSVCSSHLFSLCSHHCIVMKFSGTITIDMSDVHVKCHGRRSKVKVTDVKTQFNRFRTVAPVWIHIWRWRDAQNLIWHRRDTLLFFKVIRQISRSQGTKNRRFYTRIGRFQTVTPVRIHIWLQNDAQTL